MSDLDNRLIYEALKGKAGEREFVSSIQHNDKVKKISVEQQKALTKAMEGLILDFIDSKNYSELKKFKELNRYQLDLNRKNLKKLKNIYDNNKDLIYYKLFTELEGNDEETNFFYIDENLPETIKSNLLSLVVESQYKQGVKRNRDIEDLVGKTIYSINFKNKKDRPTYISPYDITPNPVVMIIPADKETIKNVINNVIPESNEDNVFDEGEKEQKLQKFRVRNRAVILQAKELNRKQHGGKLTCVYCNLQPETKYYREGQVLSPEQTNALIEGHHKKGELVEGEVTVNDIECLCGNCHRYKHI